MYARNRPCGGCVASPDGRGGISTPPGSLLFTGNPTVAACFTPGGPVTTGARRSPLQAQLDGWRAAVVHIRALIGCCTRARERLKTFDYGEKRLALEAPGTRVA